MAESYRLPLGKRIDCPSLAQAGDIYIENKVVFVRTIADIGTSAWYVIEDPVITKNLYNAVLDKNVDLSKFFVWINSYARKNAQTGWPVIESWGEFDIQTIHEPNEFYRNIKLFGIF